MGQGVKICYIIEMKRIIFDVILFLSVLLWPWWLTVILAIVGLWLFRDYYEFLVLGIIFFAIYNSPAIKEYNQIISSPIWYPLILVILFIGAEQIKKIIILYRNNE